MPLSDELRILAERIMQRREAVFFAADGVPVTFETELRKLENQQLRIANAVKPTLIKAVMAASRYSLQMSTLRFVADSITTDGQDIIFPLSASQLVGDGRTEQRMTFAKGELASCEFLNPYDLETVLTREIIDLSASGMSLRSLNASDLLVAGTALSGLKLNVTDEPAFTRNGVVVYTRQLVNLKGSTFFQTGIKFQA